MSAADLVGEYVAALRRMRLADARALMAHGIPVRAITRVCPVPARIALDAAGDLYQPDPDGAPAWVLPVRRPDLPDPEAIEADDPAAVVSAGPVVDLVAFAPAAPGRWALRRGAAAVLGAVPPQLFDPPPVPVHRDVVAWLRAGGAGLALLTRDPYEAGRILRRCATIEAGDERHAAELRRLVELPQHPGPAIIARPAIRRAA